MTDLLTAYIAEDRPAEHPRPPVDHNLLAEQMRELLRHENTFPPGRASRYDRNGNETDISQGER